MYGVDDLYRIKDIVHSVDKNHWESKKWLADKLFELYGYNEGKFYVAGGWYGMMAYHLRQKWPGEEMNIVSADCDPMCEDYAWDLFGDADIDFRTVDVNDEQDFSEYSGIINTSCEHMEQEDLVSIIERKNPNTWICFQTNDFDDLNSHINCFDTSGEFERSLNLDTVKYSGTIALGGFNRHMVIGR